MNKKIMIIGIMMLIMIASVSADTISNTFKETLAPSGTTLEPGYCDMVHNNTLYYIQPYDNRTAIVWFDMDGNYINEKDFVTFNPGQFVEYNNKYYMATDDNIKEMDTNFNILNDNYIDTSGMNCTVSSRMVIVDNNVYLKCPITNDGLFYKYNLDTQSLVTTYNLGGSIASKGSDSIAYYNGYFYILPSSGPENAEIYQETTNGMTFTGDYVLRHGIDTITDGNFMIYDDKLQLYTTYYTSPERYNVYTVDEYPIPPTECDNSLSTTPCTILSGNTLTLDGNYHEIINPAESYTAIITMENNTHLEGNGSTINITGQAARFILTEDSITINNINIYTEGVPISFINNDPVEYVNITNSHLETTWNYGTIGSNVQLKELNIINNTIIGSMDLYTKGETITQGVITNNNIERGNYYINGIELSGLGNIYMYNNNLNDMQYDFFPGFIPTTANFEASDASTAIFENGITADQPEFTYYSNYDDQFPTTGISELITTNQTLDLTKIQLTASTANYEESGFINPTITYYENALEETTSSSSSSSANYAVDEEGNIIGIVANGQLITSNGKTTTTTSPTLSLTGNQAGQFNIGEAIRNLWNNIKGWLIK